MNDQNPDGFELNKPLQGKAQENLFMRLVWMIIIGVMISFAHTILTFVTILQFVVTIFNGRQPNEQLADFGTTLGIWVAKAARYQTAASEVKPWPWSDLD